MVEYLASRHKRPRFLQRKEKERKKKYLGGWDSVVPGVVLQTVFVALRRLQWDAFEFEASMVLLVITLSQN